MSISPGVIPRVSRPPTTTVFSARAAGGSSHSNVTPTRSSPRPSAYTISVADGSRETRRTESRIGAGRAAQCDELTWLVTLMMRFAPVPYPTLFQSERDPDEVIPEREHQHNQPRRCNKLGRTPSAYP